MDDFFMMNGYAAYIWPAYGFAALMLGGLVLQTLYKGRKK